MNKTFQVGQVVQFVYDAGKIGTYPEVRTCDIEKVGNTYIQGWDTTAKGYRTFTVKKMSEVR